MDCRFAVWLFRRASLLIPIFLFVEAIQVWWPHSFLNRPFRYAAQFFLILVVSSLLYLHWNVPADTLDNAAGGIIGYELGQSLSQLLTIYGATFFLLVFGVVCSLWHLECSGAKLGLRSKRCQVIYKTYSIRMYRQMNLLMI